MKKYKLIVTSWENDGDHYETHEMAFDNKDKAEIVLKLCKELFIDSNGGIGNLYDERGKTTKKICIEYLQKNPNVVDVLIKDGESIYETIMDINNDIMGYSDCYGSRVFESGEIKLCS